MVCSEIIKHQFSIIRVTFEFYPLKGGSITHICQLSKKIKPWIKNQMIIAPDFGDICYAFDQNFGIPIIRLRYPKRLECLKIAKVSVVPLILTGYAINVAKFLKGHIEKDTIIYTHGTLLGSILTIILHKFMRLNAPIVIIQDSANLFRISTRSALSARIALMLFKISKSSYLLIVDDGTGVSDTYKMYKRYGISCESVVHAIDADFFTPMHLENKKYGFVVLSTQRLDPFKRVDLGIMGFKRFLENAKYPHEARLLIVGKGMEENKLRDLVERESLKNWVEFCGERKIEEIREYLNMSDVVIGTSLKSNLNLSIQEAMACGKPVIVFNSGETEKLIRDMENGLVAEPGDIDDFARKLEILYKNQDLRKKLGENARKTIINKRSWEIRIKKELEICEKLLLENTQP